MSAVVLQHINKTYDKGKVIAVHDVNLNIEQGELFGLIGPDGAGKTSIFRILCTLLLPDSGTATVDGFDVVKDYKNIRQTVGYMPGKFSLYSDLTVEENLNFFATLFNTTLEENRYLIEDIYVQIEPFKHRRAGQLSGGMKQKLALCCALIHKPTVLFLDEPTTGVDPVSRKEFWEMLKRLKKLNITIVVSTPYMDEANLCDRIALIQKGEILALDTPENISASYPKKLYDLKTEHIPAALNALRQLDLVQSCNSFGDSIHVTFKDDAKHEDVLESELKQEGLHDFKLSQIPANIEDCFINYIQNG